MARKITIGALIKDIFKTYPNLWKNKQDPYIYINENMRIKLGYWDNGIKFLAFEVEEDYAWSRNPYWNQKVWGYRNVINFLKNEFDKEEIKEKLEEALLTRL